MGLHWPGRSALLTQALLGQQVCPRGRVICGRAELPFVRAGPGRVPSASGLQSLRLSAGNVPGQGQRPG